RIEEVREFVKLRRPRGAANCGERGTRHARSSGRALTPAARNSLRALLASARNSQLSEDFVCVALPTSLVEHAPALEIRPLEIGSPQLRRASVIERAAERQLELVAQVDVRGVSRVGELDRDVPVEEQTERAHVAS